MHICKGWKWTHCKFTKHKYSSTYIDFSLEYNDKDPKFKVENHVRTLKYKNIYVKRWPSKLVWRSFFNLKSVLWTYVVSDLNGEEIVGTFYEQELQKTNRKEFRVENVIKRKGNVDNLFNSLIDKKDTV